MWIGEFEDYRSFLKALIKTFPKNGRGQARKLAEHLNIAPVVVSYVLTGDRDFTPDQGVQVASYFGLDERATEYLLNLIHLARAETKELKVIYKKKLEGLRDEAKKIKNIVAESKELTELEKATFYSNWYYSGVRVLSSIKEYQTVDAIANYFGLSRSMVGGIVSFLVSTGLCVEESGKIRVGSRSTHVGDTDRFVNSHRRNWRQKGIEKMTEPDGKDLFYSSAVSISEKDAEEVRKEMLELIKRFSKRVVDSRDEKVMCINLDWFSF